MWPRVPDPLERNLRFPVCDISGNGGTNCFMHQSCVREVPTVTLNFWLTQYIFINIAFNVAPF